MRSRPPARTGSPAFGRIRKTASSAPVGPGSRSRSSTRNSPSPMPTPRSSSATASANASTEARLAFAEIGSELARPRLRRGQRLRGRRSGVETTLERRQLVAGGRRPRQQVVVVGGAEAPPRVRDPLQLPLDVLEPVGLGLQRGEERAQVGADLAQAQLDVAQLLTGTRELGREPLERGERALGGGREPGRALALVRRDRLGGSGRSFGELGDVAQPLTLVPERLLAARLEALRRLDERRQLAQARLLGCGAARQLVVPPAGGGQLAPGDPGLAAAALLLLADERRRARRAGTTVGRDGAARTGPTSRSGARRRPRDPRGRRRAPTRMRACARRRRRAGRARGRARPPAPARRAR